MKPKTITTRIHNVRGPGDEISEEITINTYEDISEAISELGSEKSLEIINQFLIQKARIKWRENKMNEIHPPRKIYRKNSYAE